MRPGEVVSRIIMGVVAFVLVVSGVTLFISVLGDQTCKVSEDRPIYPVNGTIEMSESPLRKEVEVEVVERQGEWLIVKVGDRQGRVHDPNEDLCAERE